ncbi:hypothetical protein A2U01_0089779, partial [Trifolium medium]|nr:hypothetical protein [Trifolium medium]
MREQFPRAEEEIDFCTSIDFAKPEGIIC